MCLGVPGQVVEVEENPLGIKMGVVSFAGIRREVCLSYTPEAKAGDYVLVHVGFAISRIDEEHAREVWDVLEKMGELEGPESPTKAGTP